MTSKAKNLAVKARICSIARVVACASFLVLTIIGVSSLVRAMSLENLANENGIPAVWEIGSLGNPNSITVPITYWDQKADACDDENRQFEWTACNRYRTHGVLMGMVKPTLGSDGLPVPAFVDSESSWNNLHDAFSINVVGNDPLLENDNFYRWFHEVPGVSKRIDERTVTFKRTAKGTYVYGGQDVYPIDDVPGLDKDDTQLEDWNGELHNFNFTAHLRFGIKVNADGKERFTFSGDDDVWVFLNNRLILDIGGLHGPITGWFQINTDGTVTTSIEKVNNLNIRDEDWATCMRIIGGVYADESCIGPYNDIIRDNFTTVTTRNIDFGLSPDDVVNLDFFYAERSTDGSNTQITINDMSWPISADSHVTNKIVGKVGDTNSNIIQYDTHITNRDPNLPLDLIRMATYISETAEGVEPNQGFLPLSGSTLYYTTTPEDDESWQLVDISAPNNTMDGFKLTTPLRMSPYGQDGDTLYFRFYAETADAPYGKVDCLTSYYTNFNKLDGITYDDATISYGTPTVPDQPDPIDPDPVNPDRTYTVTVKYIYSDGSEALPDRGMTNLKSGDDFTFITPDINGFTPDQSMVTGQIVDHDLVYTVTYYPEQEEQLYKVIIDYVYENGDPAHESYEGNYKPSTEFSIDSPAIPDYTPNKPVVDGIVEDRDLHYTVVYKATPNTPTPGPEIPTTPEQPDNPPIGTIIPPNPGLGDASLIYLAPLGAVAFVPNTGVISDAVANLFDDGFAEVILSQGFVMGILLIFAGAFAIYFSLRDAVRANEAKKQRALARAAASARSRARTVKSSSRTVKKVARKTAAATTRTAKKSTKKSHK